MQSAPECVTQGCVQTAFEHLQGRSPQSLWVSCSRLSHPQQKVLSHFQVELSIHQFCPLLLSHVSAAPCSVPSLQTMTDMAQVPSPLSLLGAEQTLLPQGFLITEALQSPPHLCSLVPDLLQELHSNPQGEIRLQWFHPMSYHGGSEGPNLHIERKSPKSLTAMGVCSPCGVRLLNCSSEKFLLLWKWEKLEKLHLGVTLPFVHVCYKYNKDSFSKLGKQQISFLWHSPTATENRCWSQGSSIPKGNAFLSKTNTSALSGKRI